MNEILLESFDMNVTNQNEAFQIIATMVGRKMNVSKVAVFKSLLTREKAANTALVKGVAIPHIILNYNFSPWLLISKSNTLISDWDCLDNSKVNKLICLVVPQVVKKSSISFKGVIDIMTKLADDTVIKEINKAKNAAEIVIEDVFIREKEGETGIGQGVAIPHGKSSAVKNTKIAIGLSDHPIPWETLDNKPVTAVILFAVRDQDASSLHLKLLQQVAVLLSDDDFISKLHAAKNKRNVIDLLCQK